MFAVALQGMGDTPGWKGFGSVESPGPQGKTCQYDGSWGSSCESDCGSCTDECWWTTCNDSVAQTLEVLEYAINNFCVDLESIWGAGCSNGGMFLHELASDSRSASYFAGIAPMVGLPHFGFNDGPTASMSYFGIWGVNDDVVPPEESADDSGVTVTDRAAESNGWFYQTSASVLEKWRSDMNCDAVTSMTPPADFS